MGNYYPLQQDFSGGELSPRLYGQANTDRYHKSVETMTNFIALPQGPAMRRQGFAYVAEALNTTDIRLLPFKVPGSADYVVELGPGYIGLLSRDASRIDPSIGGRETFTTSELVKNGDFKEALLNWTTSTTDSNLYATTIKDKKRVQIIPAKGVDEDELLSVKQTIVTGGATGNIEFEFTWWALCSEFQGNINVLSRCVVEVGTTPGGDELYSAQFDGEDNGRLVLGYEEGASRSLFNDGSYRDRFRTARERVTINIGVNDPVYITLSAGPYTQGYGGGDSGGRPLCMFDDIQFSADAVVSDTFATPWVTEADLALVQYVAESGGNRMYFTHPNYPPQLLEQSEGSWSFAPMPITSPPVSWTGSNWPAVIEFYQGRLWLAATPLDSSTIWASKSGNPFDFTTGVNDDDAMELPLSTTGGIKWVKGQKGLAIGTDIGEQIITSQGSLITPTDRKAAKQSGWGSVDIQPSLAGNDIVYVSQDRTKVRAINTYFNTASWTSVDLTWVAEHITRAKVIESIYIQNPNYQLYFLLGDGTIVACTYDREHETVGWMNLVTDGNFVSMTKTDSVQGTILWVGVRRNEQIFIEAIDPQEESWEFTDSWVSQAIDSNNLVTGLDHLEGLTVQILVDGAIDPDQVVVGGEITTVNPGSFAVVGIQYEASMTTLPLSEGNKEGTALGSKARYSEIQVQLHDSALPLINGRLPADRSPATPMNTVEPNKTGVAESRNLGREDGGRVTITQNLPKKTMVTAIYGKASTERT